MARKGGIGGKKDRIFITNVVANGKEDFQLNSKLANLEVQKHKEMARLETEKNKLILPSLRKNGGISLTPPSSPTTSPTRSPLAQRRKSDVLVTDVAAARLQCKSQTMADTDVVGLRRSKSSQNVRINVGPKPPPSPVCRSPGAASPRLLNRRSTIAQTFLFAEEANALRQANDTGRRFSAGVVPSIRVEESAGSLSEKVKKFNESLKRYSKKSNTNAVEQLDDSPPIDEPTKEPSDELSIPSRPVAHRWKSLPNIFPILGSQEKTSEEMTFYEDMKRCRYLRIPEPPPLSIDQIFDRDSKQIAGQK